MSLPFTQRPRHRPRHFNNGSAPQAWLGSPSSQTQATQVDQVTQPPDMRMASSSQANTIVETDEEEMARQVAGQWHALSNCYGQ